MAIRDPCNVEAWERFVALYTPLVFGHCVRRGLQEADAADVAQEVMKSIARAIGRFEYDRRRGSFRAWLLTVTRSKLSNFFAQRARRAGETGETALAGVPSPDDARDAARWEREYEARLLAWAMDQVRKDVQAATWNAFWSTAVEGREVADVASRLGLSTGAVYVARSRVIARIRRCIAEADPDTPVVPRRAERPGFAVGEAAAPFDGGVPRRHGTPR